ncbi:MAG: pyruvate kinase alpha/beta domain-containing protein [Hominenteromicrobium sp.]
MTFLKPGPENTGAALHAALEAAVRKHLDIVVASNTGNTVETLLAMEKSVDAPVRIVMVGQVDGFSAPGTNALTAEKRAALESQGVRIVTAAHALSGAERGISRKFGGVYPAELVAASLRMLSQGVKVCVEIAMMALDCGAVAYGRPVVCVGGTGRGADTVCVVTPAYTAGLFDTKIHEILCKPGHYEA